MSQAASTAESGNYPNELVIERVFDAPRERVWKAWTEPEQMKRWWGPRNFTTPVCEIDFRVGGKYLYNMRSPEGRDYWGTGVYREIVPMERIVSTDSFADEHGNVVPASHYGMEEDWPLELLVTVRFEEHQGKTKLTLRHSGLPAGENSDSTKAGWNESLDKLAESLGESHTSFMATPGTQEIVMERVLDAPVQAVWDAFTDPRLVPEWWGPKGLTTIVDEMGLRPGGSWRYRQRDPQGIEYGFHGIYHEISPPRRLVRTSEFEGAPGHAALEIVNFQALPNGKTKVTAKAIFESIADREAALDSDMESGAVETWERFAELLAGRGYGEQLSA